MIDISIPGYAAIKIEHLVLDYNGTIAIDGHPIQGVREILNDLAEHVQIHVITADTFGDVIRRIAGFPCRLSILPAGDQDVEKLAYIQKLGAIHTACIGNGRNDRLMLKEAALGIAVILDEGACIETLLSADIVCNDIISALKLLTNPLRLRATLRS